jgi:hypothetical protein
MSNLLRKYDGRRQEAKERRKVKLANELRQRALVRNGEIAMSKDQKEVRSKELEAISQTVNTAIASLMDVCNYLRDIPKLVAANQSLAAEVASLKERLSKYESVEAAPAAEATTEAA